MFYATTALMITGAPMFIPKQQRATAYAALILGAATGAIASLAEMFGHAIGSPAALGTPNTAAYYLVGFTVLTAGITALAFRAKQ